jgi:serine/threonine protein kinase
MLLENPRSYRLHRASVDSSEMSTMAVIPLATAPEAIAGDVYTIKVDVYSLGVTLYMLFTTPTKFDESKPFPKARVPFLNKVQTGSRYAYVDGMPPFYWDLIRACWAGDPNKQPSAVQIVQLLVNDRRWVFEGANTKELDAYEAKVLAGLEQEWANEPNYDPMKPDTSETARASGGRDMKFDAGVLGEKMIELKDIERCEESTTDADQRLFKVRQVEDDEMFWMKVMNTLNLKYYMWEIDVMAMIKHPAALLLVGWQLAGKDGEPLIIMDWCPNGTLADALARRERRSRWPGGMVQGSRRSLLVLRARCGRCTG